MRLAGNENFECQFLPTTKASEFTYFWAIIGILENSNLNIE